MFNFGPKNYDFVSIGDTVIDAFIRLKEAHITCKIDKTECEICMKFGDKIPFESVEICNAVGNSANAAVSASRLGLQSAIITNIGDDQNAKDVLKTFKQEKVGTSYVMKHEGKKTNYHYVLWFDSERTILIKHEDYKYSFPEITPPKWLYLSSLGENSLEFHDEISKFLRENPEVKLAFQPGTYQIRFGKEKLKGIYSRSEIFFCNKEEVQRILDTKEVNIQALMKELAKIGPKIIVVTDGPNGAYAHDTRGAEALSYFMPTYPDIKPPFERTGAGDAFASTFTSAIILGESVETALLWAPINSMTVVQDVGAQKGLLSKEKLLEYLAKAPKDYKVKVLS